MDEPIAMRITCPGCGELHIDEGEFATKPHHTHACQHCGLTWRPAVVATVGVRFLPGFKNAAPTPRPEAPTAVRLCADCKANEADECFTVCGPCWDKAYPKAPSPDPAAPTANQCDGCNAGRPIDANGNHAMSDGEYRDLMHCQAYRYAPSPDPERAGANHWRCCKEVAALKTEIAAMDRVIEAARRAMSGAGFYGDLEIAIAELDAYRAGRKGGAK